MNKLILSEEELTELMLQTGTYNIDDSVELKQQWHKQYRKVETETNQQIKDAGGVENWYASGIGRLI